MTPLQALVYFAREALSNLFRSWKVSLLAILTIAVSLFLAGTFFLVSGNLRQLVGRWQGESKVVIYLETGVEEADHRRVRRLAEATDWTAQVIEVSGEEAQQRFREAFPSMADLLEGWKDDPLPASFEVSLLQADSRPRKDFELWLEQLREDSAVSMVDDDRDWLDQLQTAVLVVEGLGLALGIILLVTSIFTISSVIRLTAYLYRDEIAVMRLVGATEFYIRGPFYLEGLFQGLAGGVLAVSLLAGAHGLILRRSSAHLVSSVLAGNFLPAAQLALLIGLGGLAGLIGAASSLRREALGRASASETP